MAVLGNSVRQFLFDAIAARLALIREGDTLTDNGIAYTFKTSIGERVIEGLREPSQLEGERCVFVEEADETPDAEAMVGQYDRELLWVVQGVEKYNGRTPGARAREMLADIQMVMGTTGQFTAPISTVATQSIPLRVIERTNVLNGKGILKGLVYVHTGYSTYYVTSLRNPNIAKQT